MEKKGFIVREVTANDKRAKYLFLSDKGKQFKEYFYSLFEKWETLVTDGMDTETRDLIFKGIQSIATQAANANFSDLIESKK